MTRFVLRFSIVATLAVLLLELSTVTSLSAHAATKKVQTSNFCTQNLVQNTQINGWAAYTLTTNGKYHILIQDEGINLDRSFDVFIYLLEDTSNGGEFVLQTKYFHYLQSSGVQMIVGTSVEMSISYDAVNLDICGGGWSAPTFIWYPHLLTQGQPVQ